jgi:hypothetical protein
MHDEQVKTFRGQQERHGRQGQCNELLGEQVVWCKGKLEQQDTLVKWLVQFAKKATKEAVEDTAVEDTANQRDRYERWSESWQGVRVGREQELALLLISTRCLLF